MKVTYISSHAGEATYLKQAIYSVYRDCVDTDINYTHKIFLDGCDQRTSVMLDRLPLSIQKHINIYSSQENQGKSYAVNTLINNVQDGLIFFLDSDDIVLPGKTAKLIRAHKESNSQHILGSNYYSWSFQKCSLFKPSNYPINDKEIRLNFPVFPYLLYSSMSCDVELLRRHNLIFDTKIKAGLDYEFYYRALQNVRFYNLKSCLVLYRINNSGLTASRRQDQLNSHREIVSKLFSIDHYSPSQLFLDVFMHFLVSTDYYLDQEYLADSKKELIDELTDIILLIDQRSNSSISNIDTFWKLSDGKRSSMGLMRYITILKDILGKSSTTSK